MKLHLQYDESGTLIATATCATPPSHPKQITVSADDIMKKVKGKSGTSILPKVDFDSASYDELISELQNKNIPFSTTEVA